MKRAVRNLILFFFCLITADQAWGLVFNYLKEHSNTGIYVDATYIKDSVNADIIVLGSSRSLRHYNPFILEDSLGLKCEVCGLNSNGIITMYDRFSQICNRYTPKIIIYDVMPEFDVQKEDHSKYVPQLRLGGDQTARQLISEIDPKDKIKSLSQMYCHNSNAFSMISDFLSLPQSRNNGYQPYKDSIKYATKSTKPIYSPDGFKMMLFRKMMRMCKAKGIRIIFFVSPAYGNNYYYSSRPVEEVCKQEGVPFINDNFCAISKSRDNFHDSVHLNEAGSTKYTNMVIRQIKAIYNR